MLFFVRVSPFPPSCKSARIIQFRGREPHPKHGRKTRRAGEHVGQPPRRMHMSFWPRSYLFSSKRVSLFLLFSLFDSKAMKSNEAWKSQTCGVSFSLDSVPPLPFSRINHSLEPTSSLKWEALTFLLPFTHPLIRRSPPLPPPRPQGPCTPILFISKSSLALLSYIHPLIPFPPLASLSRGSSASPFTASHITMSSRERYSATSHPIEE